MTSKKVIAVINIYYTSYRKPLFFLKKFLLKN